MAKQTAPQGAEPVTESVDETAARLASSATSQGKGAPTPTRKEQEAARKRPLVSDNRKEASRQAKIKAAEAREKQRAGMAAGDDRYLPMRDRGPQKRYARDYVDARFNIGEFMLPVMALVIVLTFIPSYEIQMYGIFALWGFFLIAVVDSIILGFSLTKRLAAKFGADKVEKVRWYSAMRALQMRFMRLPKAQVARGAYPS
ncbi:DUF3043 domain-containing protein [Orlajensenia leifsoniae]|uniref:DUF3043 domain-containing protein n=1 Tax=Orlajensenia leifsoniae TaxID=2561933 RepID=A0A4Y9R4Z7_9MICO|nr:DUF3043 domain-containing protein [Leifsonia flava]TFV99168.1 DUF3043 domain-containing protein [Leifsonia flava]